MTPEEEAAAFAEMEASCDRACPHYVDPPSDCVVCDDRPNVIMRCESCDGNHWHVQIGESWRCRVCQETRGDPDPTDTGIGNH